MLTLYHAPRSRSSRIVWLLEELRAEYALKITDIPRMDGSGAPDPAELAGLSDSSVMRRTFRDRTAVNSRLLAALGAGPYLLGEQFSGTDILIASMGQFVRTMLPAGAVVDAYLERCNARPALARAALRDDG